MQNIAKVLFSKVNKSEIATLLGISRRSVYNKLKNNSFTLDEIDKIARSKGYTLLLVVSDSIIQ